MDSLESEPSIPLVQKPDMTLTLQAQQSLISNFLRLTTEFCFFKIQREKKRAGGSGGATGQLGGSAAVPTAGRKSRTFPFHRRPSTTISEHLL